MNARQQNQPFQVRNSARHIVLRATYLLLVGLCLLAFSTQFAAANPRYASIIVEESTGKTLYSRNADKLLYPASLTKIMTLYIVFEELQRGTLGLDTKMRVSKLASGRSPSKLNLEPGSTISVKNAILALVTKSANDVSTVISEHVSGSEQDFARRMTRKARALNMKKTVFKNASGLPNRAQKSTAREMALLGIAIRRDFPQYYHYFKIKKFRYNGRQYKNHNNLLSRYTGTDGIKTGFTSASGFNLVASVERDGVRLVGVVFGGRTGARRDQHLISLLTKQFGRVPDIQLAALSNTALPNTALPNTAPAPRPFRPEVQPALETASISPAIGTSDKDQYPWMIQVGSFTRRITAHKAAIQARRKAGQSLLLVPADISMVMRGDMPLWRVRFAGLGEDQARAACAELYARGNACFALPDILAKNG